LRRPTVENLLHLERSLVDHLVDPEGSPHGDMFAIPVDSPKSLIKVKVNAGLG
jgi:hypothetical protein